MIKRTLTLENFRRFTSQSITLTSKTLLVGPNGAGKSTVIEALRLLSVAKSFRTNRLDEAIAFDAPYWRLSLATADRRQTMEFFYGLPFADAPKQRHITVGGKTKEILEFVGAFPTVLFVPGDIDLVLGAPQGRRRFLDGVLWQVDAAFRRDYLDFSRVLRERAALLFLLKNNRVGRDELAPWNELLEKLTSQIRQKRHHFVDFLRSQLQQEKIGRLQFAVTYHTSHTPIAELERQEIQTAQNLFGAHRDELEILLDDRSARRFASRGQARSAVILLKIIESRYLAEQAEQKPTILLDDIFSELDETNAAALFAGLHPDFPTVVTALQPPPLLNKFTRVEL